VGVFGVERASDGKFCHSTVEAYMHANSKPRGHIRSLIR